MECTFNKEKGPFSPTQFRWNLEESGVEVQLFTETNPINFHINKEASTHLRTSRKWRHSLNSSRSKCGTLKLTSHRLSTRVDLFQALNTAVRLTSPGERRGGISTRNPGLSLPAWLPLNLSQPQCLPNLNQPTLKEDSKLKLLLSTTISLGREARRWTKLSRSQLLWITRRISRDSKWSARPTELLKIDKLTGQRVWFPGEGAMMRRQTLIRSLPIDREWIRLLKEVGVLDLVSKVNLRPMLSPHWLEWWQQELIQEWSRSQVIMALALMLEMGSDLDLKTNGFQDTMRMATPSDWTVLVLEALSAIVWPALALC